MRNLLLCIFLMNSLIQIIHAQQTPAPFVIKVYDDIYQVMHTRQSPEKPNLVLSDNSREIALYSPSMNQIAIGQDFIDLARSFGKDSMNVVAQVLSHELAHVLLEQSTIIKNIGSGYASKEFNKRLKKINASLRDSLYERQADEYSFFYAQIAGYPTSELAPRILDSIYKQWNLKNSDLKRYPPLVERKLIATTASKKIKILKDLFDVAMLASLSGNYNLSIDLYKFILEEDFNSREIHNNLGTAYLMKAISNLDSISYPYVFPVQMDLNTKLESERGFDINVENDIRKALRQFTFACEGKEKYPIAMLNKAICEWLLEDEEFEISMIRLSKLKNSKLDPKIAILKSINEFHFENDTLKYTQALIQLKKETALAQANLNKLASLEIQNKSYHKRLPKFDIPDFDFYYDNEARKSDTLYKAFGSNARGLKFRKLENDQWSGIYIKSNNPPSFTSLRVFAKKQSKNKKIKVNNLRGFEFGNFHYILDNKYIYGINRFNEIEYIYHIN